MRNSRSYRGGGGGGGVGVAVGGVGGVGVATSNNSNNRRFTISSAWKNKKEKGVGDNEDLVQ